MRFAFMPPTTLTGNIQKHRAFPSRILKNRRDILVYLPPGYRRFSARQYPVLYLQDGQNVFDAATSFAGVEWGVDETAQRLIRQKLIEPMIIVAIANVGEDRIHEYAPTPARIDPPKRKRSKGLLRSYGRFLIEELKPFIDRKYRTRREAEFTGLGGSSLGGLATLALGLWFPNYFTRLAVLSPSIWWDDCAIYDIVDEIDETAKPPLKIWLDTGTHEPGWERAASLRDRLTEKGWRLHDDLHYLEVEGADHSEGAWAARVDPVLRFLFPPSPPATAKVALVKKRRPLLQRAFAFTNLFSA
jgi:predicted alpha/beta superfamily hydrolase